MGVPIIPTTLASNVKTDTLHEISAFGNQWQTVILKPTVGLGGSHAYRVPLHELDNTLTMLGASQPRHEYLIQPFIESVTSEGDMSFILLLYLRQGSEQQYQDTADRHDVDIELKTGKCLLCPIP